MKRKRVKHLQLINAVLRGDMDAALQIHGKSKNPLRLLFAQDREHSDRYVLISQCDEFSKLKRELLYTKSEALDMAEGYSGCLFIHRSSKTAEDIPESEMKRISQSEKSFDEKIIVTKNGTTKISNGEYATKPGERVNINVKINK